MRKNKHKKIIFPLIAIALFSIFLYGKASAQGEEGGIGVLQGDSGYNAMTGTMENAEQGTTRVLNDLGSASTSSGSTGAAYKNQEKIPGANPTSDFTQYMKDIIGFGYAIIGILAMFMLSIGAYQYLMAAGNLAKVESAKQTISSALMGLVLGIASFVILRTINPDLVSLRGPSLGSLTGGGGTGNGGGGGGGGGGAGSGQCVPVSSGPCSEEYLAGTCFGSHSYQASSICNAESGGNPGALSGSDKCKDGNSFSVGLFQINLTVHKISGLDCPSAFSAKNYGCTVSNQGLYNQCVQAAQDPTTNINYACSIGNNGSNWGPWGANKKCGF